jgi:general secretion pathway protein D
MRRRKNAVLKTGLLALALLCATALPMSAQRAGGFGNGGNATSSAATTRAYPNSTMVGEAMITSDPETRNLIIITDEETNANIKQVIASLDQPKPQVLINVVFLQVTHNDDLNFGVEGRYTHTSSSGNSQSGGTDFGIAAAQTAFGGGFYSFANDDIDLMIRALQVNGKTEILSRPSILARNNQEATIMVGQSVPFITNSRITDTGQTVNTVQYQDIGIILRVTPFITKEGLVEMILSPEISALSDQTVPISNTVSSPVIDKRSADTVVVTPSGKTIVIGGLIASQKVEQVRKVPLLGDIPLLGWAFKRTVKKDTKTELLIFMTPNVVRDADEMARLSISEGEKLEMAPKVFKQEQLDRFVEGIPLKYVEEAKEVESKKENKK